MPLKLMKVNWSRQKKNNWSTLCCISCNFFLKWSDVKHWLGNFEVGTTLKKYLCSVSKVYWLGTESGWHPDWVINLHLTDLRSLLCSAAGFLCDFGQVPCLWLCFAFQERTTFLGAGMHAVIFPPKTSSLSKARFSPQTRLQTLPYKQDNEAQTNVPWFPIYTVALLCFPRMLVNG